VDLFLIWLRAGFSCRLLGTHHELLDCMKGGKFLHQMCSGWVRRRALLYEVGYLFLHKDAQYVFPFVSLMKQRNFNLCSLMYCGFLLVTNFICQIYIVISGYIPYEYFNLLFISTVLSCFYWRSSVHLKIC